MFLLRSLSSISKILIIQSASNVFDQAVDIFKKLYPEAEVSILAPQEFASQLNSDTRIDRIILSSHKGKISYFKLSKDIRKKIRRERYDLIVTLYNNETGIGYFNVDFMGYLFKPRYQIAYNGNGCEGYFIFSKKCLIKKFLKDNPLLEKLNGFYQTRKNKRMKERRDKKREKEKWHTIAKRVKKQKKENYRKKRILAIYDFIDLPFSYDIATFLVNADLERRKRKCEKIDVAFVCHASDPGPPRHPYVNKDNFRNYLHNLGLEMTRLMDSVGSIFVFDNRKLFIDFFKKFKRTHYTFPRDYKPSIPIEIRSDRPAVNEWINSARAAKKDSTVLSLNPQKEQVDIIRKWILKNIYPFIPVTITLREWDTWASKRNSKITEWQKLINSYQDSKIRFIVLRDYYKLYDDPVFSGKNVVYYNEPVIMTSLRAALYQESSLNLFINNGCLALGYFNRKTRYIVFKITTDDRGARLVNLLSIVGLQPGDNLQGSTKYQRIVWEDDNFETMKCHVDKMIKLLQEDNILIPSYYDEAPYKNLDKEMRAG